MKRNSLPAKLLFVAIASAAATFGGPIVTTTTDASRLATALLSPGMTILGIPTLIGASDQQGTFVGGLPNTIGFPSGVLLTSGSAASAAGDYAGKWSPNTEVGTSGDADLSAVIDGAQTYDANSLSFQFTSNTQFVQYLFTFASAEYPDVFGAPYNDPVGIFVNGTNYALIPGTNLPVSVDNVDIRHNASMFSCWTGIGACYNSAGAPTPYGGQTRAILLTIPVSTTQTNTN